MRAFSIALIAAGLTASVAHAQPAFPQTQSDHYQVGQKFAFCSAYYGYAASLARANGLPDSAVAFEDMERGWKVAGIFLLLGGLDETRRSQVAEIFGNLQAIKLTQIRAKREIVEARGDPFDPATDYQAECGEWSDLRKAIIQALRSGPTTP